MMKLISIFIFRITGWKAVGEVPPLKKCVVIFAPHTSGWELPLGLLAKWIFNIQISFLAKREIFWFPAGLVLRVLGGIPVDRSAKHNMVEQAVMMFNKREQLMLVIAPEGTRRYVPKWKTGFYHIAVKAEVPVSLAYIDYPSKSIGFGPLFYPTGDIDKDIENIMSFYRTKKGIHPELGVL